MEQLPNAIDPALAATGAAKRLRLLSYNIQVGISSTRPHHYLTKSWKHVLNHPRRFETLQRIAELLSGYDIVGLQEVDAGSSRTGNINLTEYLADQAGFNFWHHQLNRDFAGIARHANGLLSHMRPMEVAEHRLPGLVPGRGAVMARFGSADNPLIVLLIHLALGRRSRMQQLEYVADLVNRYPHAVVMGDMNCAPDSPEMAFLFQNTRLREPAACYHTFPSWRPNRNIDHILVTDELVVTRCEVIKHAFSDHLPIAMEIGLPEALQLVG